MADGITLTVSGLQQVQDRFDAMPARVQAALTVAMDKLGAGFIDYLRRTKLSGSPLARRTGALQQSFTYHTTAHSEDVTLTISSDSPYAAYHEYGYHGTVNVRPHERLGHPVRGFARNISYAGHPYFQPAVDEYTPRIYAEIDRAVNEALHD